LVITSGRGGLIRIDNDGGNVGGANVFVYGIRVLNRPSTPPAKALNPLGVETDEPDRAAGRQPGGSK
jgi:hypothetical protein